MRGVALTGALTIACCLQAQTTAPASDAAAQQPYTLQTGARIVLVPATVSIKDQILYGLKVNQFRITDNGVPQRVTLDNDLDTPGLSLVVLVQCSRGAVVEYGKIEALPALVESLTGAAPHEVALVRYGSHPELVQPFTRSQEKIDAAMAHMGPCEDSSAATLDAVSYATSILGNRAERNRRVVLLISESRDHGSKVREADVIAALGRTNTVVDALAYSPFRDEIMSDLQYKSSTSPLAFLVAAVQALRKNIPKAVANLSGGEYFNFESKAGFESSVGTLTNRLHNYYLLSFPLARDAGEGLHDIRVTVPEYPQATIRARRAYYAGAAAPPASVDAP